MGHISDAKGPSQRPQNYTPSTVSKNESAASSAATSKAQDSAANSELSKDIHRKLETADLNAILVKLGKENSPENLQLLMLMIEHGVETSEQAFEQLEQLIKGKKQGNIKESGVIAHSKGLKGNNKAIDLISNYLSHNLNYSKLMEQTNQKMKHFQAVLNNYSKHLDSTLLGGLSSIIGEFISDYKKNEKAKKEFDVKALLSKRSDSIQDVKYLLNFLNGLEQKLDQSKNLMQKGLSQVLKELSSDISKLQDALISQLILSKNPANIQVTEEYFHHWLIPNPLLQSKKDIELLISKDSRNKKRINPDKTKLVMKFETNDLGDMTVIIEINEKKLHYKFYSSEDLTHKFIVDYTPDLKKTMEDLNYEIVGINNNKKAPNIEKLLFPTFDLNDITRISTEV